MLNSTERNCAQISTPAKRFAYFPGTEHRDSVV